MSSNVLTQDYRTFTVKYNHLACSDTPPISARRRMVYFLSYPETEWQISCPTPGQSDSSFHGLGLHGLPHNVPRGSTSYYTFYAVLFKFYSSAVLRLILFMLLWGILSTPCTPGWASSTAVCWRVILTLPVEPRDRWFICWVRGPIMPAGWMDMVWSMVGVITAPCGQEESQHATC